MLQELAIRNFAIIDHLRIQLNSGLTVFSGETGAGKSIIINAINLLLGSRAAAGLIRKNAETAEIEARFLLQPGTAAAELLSENDFDPGEGLLIRRVISRQGRHRIYVNSRQTTIQFLTQLTRNLASISGQHAHQGLLMPEQHLLILDQFGGLLPQREEIAGIYHETTPLIKHLAELEARKKRQAEQRELLSFQREEILAAAVSPGEDEALDRQRKKLKHAETIYQSIHQTIAALYDNAGSASEQLSFAAGTLREAAKIDPELTVFTQQLEDLVYRVEDASGSLRRYLDAVQMDENLLAEIEERIDFLTKLKRKYGGTLDDVLERLVEIERELGEVENLEHRIDQTQKALSDKHQLLATLARQLSTMREHAASELAHKVERELAELKMPETRFQVALRSTAAKPQENPFLIVDGHPVGETGFNTAEFFIAPNVGEDLKPLTQIASGGELSRVVLALKAILARTDAVETIVFDEVDAGIGGGVAEVVGKKLAGLSRFHQIICITHLPQIAKFGMDQFQISKAVQKGRTITQIQRLDDDARIQEIARMLGGENITPATLAHAQEMMSSTMPE